MMSFPSPTCCFSASSPRSSASRFSRTMSHERSYMVSTMSFMRCTRAIGVASTTARRNHIGPHANGATSVRSTASAFIAALRPASALQGP